MWAGQAYIHYATSGKTAGRGLFGTWQTFSTPHEASHVLYSYPYGNDANYAWMFSFTQAQPILWGYVDNSSTGAADSGATFGVASAGLLVQVGTPGRQHGVHVEVLNLARHVGEVVDCLLEVLGQNP